MAFPCRECRRLKGDSLCGITERLFYVYVAANLLKVSIERLNALAAVEVQCSPSEFVQL
jgi:hypothetical protein